MNVILVYNNDSQIKELNQISDKSIFFKFINDNTKEAFTLKNHWCARQSPFAICMNGEKVIKAFYSESKEDVIKSLIKYINNEE